MATIINWKKRFLKHVRKVHELMVLFAIIIFPLFAFFDYETVESHKFTIVTTVRFSITIVTATWLFLQRKFKLNEKYLTFFTFSSISYFCVWVNVIANKTYLYQHNIAYCTVFLAASIFIIWHWLYSVIIVVTSTIFYVCMAYWVGLDLNEIFLSGGSALITMMVLHPAIVGFRYQAQKRDHKFRSVLEEKNESLRISKQETENKNQELLEARKEIDNYNSQLINLNQKLEQLVQQRTVKLEKTMEELDKFLYSSYHDLKAPIATLRGMTNLLNQDIEEVNLKQYRDYFNITLDNIERLLNKLNKASFIQNKDLKNDPIDFKVFLQQFNSIFEQENVNVNIVFDSNLIINSDSELLKIIFECLIQNSIEFKSDNRPCSIIISVKNWDKNIEIQFRDNGEGIPKDIFEKIFIMFYRGNVKSKGNGLGLYIVKKAVEKLEGTIEIDSRLNEFTLFTIKLPNHL